MILTSLILIPLLGGILAWASDRPPSVWPRRISLFFMFLEFLVGLFLRVYPGLYVTQGSGTWLVEMETGWLPQFGISFHLGLDGISLLMVLLTALLGIMGVLASWTEIKERNGFFHFNLLFSLAGIIGVFLALDLFLFYFFWELMLVPMYFLIALWGHERRSYGAVKFFIFTQAGGLLMLMAILGLVFVNGADTGSYSFGYEDLLGTSMAPGTATILFLGFLAAFLVKLPALPFHTWLPDAHTEAPTAGSIILAGLLLKTGAYGLIRFAVPLFPDAAARFAPAGVALGAAGIIYGAVMAFAQTDLKRLIAYTSISHMGFVLLGISVWNELALLGVVIQIICHGVSTGALFMMAGALQERIHTRELARMGGFWLRAPRMGGIGLFFALASLGLPGLGNFIAEFLILLGAYEVSPVASAVAAGGLVLAAIYALRLVWRAFFGEPGDASPDVSDLSVREMAPLSVLILVILWIGMCPQTLIDEARPGVAGLIENRTDAVMAFHNADKGIVVKKEIARSGVVRSREVGCDSL